jgi:hypothetical protein
VIDNYAAPVSRRTAALEDSVTAKWSLRLANEESLVAEPPPNSFNRTIAIRHTRGQGRHRIGVTEVEIADASGAVLLRRQRVTAAPIAAPLHVSPSAPLERGFEIGRRSVHTGRAILTSSRWRRCFAKRRWHGRPLTNALSFVCARPSRRRPRLQRPGSSR